MNGLRLLALTTALIAGMSGGMAQAADGDGASRSAVAPATKPAVPTVPSASAAHGEPAGSGVAAGAHGIVGGDTATGPDESLKATGDGTAGSDALGKAAGGNGNDTPHCMAGRQLVNGTCQ